MTKVFEDSRKPLDTMAEPRTLPSDGEVARRERVYAAVLRRSASVARRVLSASVGLLSIAVGLIVWEIVARREWVDPLFLPRLSDVLDELWSQVSSGDLNEHLVSSGLTFSGGLALSIGIGIPLGLLIGRVPLADRVAAPWLMAFNSVPRIAFIPMLIVMFGLGTQSRIAVVFMTSVFPLVINTASGSRSVDPLLLQMAKSYDVRRSLVFRRIILPATVPYVFAGVHVAVAQGLIGVVVGEMFAANSGVGYQLFRYSSLYRIPAVFAMMIVLGFAGVCLSTLTARLERHFSAWRTT